MAPVAVCSLVAMVMSPPAILSPRAVPVPGACVGDGASSGGWLVRLGFLFSLSAAMASVLDSGSGVICGGGSGRRRLLSLRSIVGVGVGGSAGAEGVSVRLVYAYRCKSSWRLLLLVRSGLHAVLEVPDLFSLGERLLGLSSFQVCIDVFGVPNVAKVGFKNFAASLEVSSSSWSLASRRTFISILVRGCGVERRLRRLAVMAAGCVLQGPDCNFSFLRGVLVSKCCKLLYQ